MFGLYFVGGVGAAVCLRFPWVWCGSVVFYCSCLIWIGCYIRRVVWFCLGFGFSVLDVGVVALGCGLLRVGFTVSTGWWFGL